LILDAYRPHSSWYLHNAHGIHGLGHAARVLLWADQIAQALLQEGTWLDLEAVRWAAALHDVGRVDDGRDRPHGQRTADWIVTRPHPWPFLQDPQRLQRVIYCCAWHTPRDELIPQMTSELVCLKDADALDRVRIHDLNPAWLRTTRAAASVGLAWELFEESVRSRGDPWSAVRECALRMGLWR
jgi:uncharacterized protein